MKITVLTPTCDRPVGIALLEAMMRRQTRQPDEWIVADGGEVPAICAMGQVHIHESRPAGAANFTHNLLNGIDAATGDLLIVCEDDDWYRADHIEAMVAMAEKGHQLLGSEDVQRYYNVEYRCHRLFNNVGASLCQTAIERSLFPVFRAAIHTCMARNKFGVDRVFWQLVGRTHWAFLRKMTVVGIKGLPGRAGLGVGHRPGTGWTPDPDFVRLRSWIGDDVDSYTNLIGPHSAALSSFGVSYA